MHNNKSRHYTTFIFISKSVIIVQYLHRELKRNKAYVGNEGNGNTSVGLYESDEHLRSDVDQQVYARRIGGLVHVNAICLRKGTNSCVRNSNEVPSMCSRMNGSSIMACLCVLSTRSNSLMSLFW